MKNSVKITIVLGIVASFFPVYPMSGGREISFVIKTKELKNVNPIGNMSMLLFECPGEPPACSFSEKGQFYPEVDLFLADEGLALSLAAIKICNEHSKKKNDVTLKTIRKAIGEGIPITSQYSIRNITPLDGATSQFLSGSLPRTIVFSDDNSGPCPLLKTIVVSPNHDYFIQKRRPYSRHSSIGTNQKMY